MIIIMIINNNDDALYLSVDVFCMKELIGDTIFTSPRLKMGPPFYLIILTTQGSIRLQSKHSTFNSQLF